MRPDLIAFSNKDAWQVSLNDDFMNKELIEIIIAEIESSKNEKVVEARSFLKGLEKRQQTLFLVGQFIINKQNQYLNKTSDKKPIVNKEIAKALAISESTVSRIVRNKYIQLPDRLIALKELLQKKVNKSEEGKDVTPQNKAIYI